MDPAPPLQVGKELTHTLYAVNVEAAVLVLRVMRTIAAEQQQCIWHNVHSKYLPAWTPGRPGTRPCTTCLRRPSARRPPTKSTHPTATSALSLKTSSTSSGLVPERPGRDIH